MSNHTDYRLEIWNGKEYIRTYAYSDGSREEHNEVIRALMNSNEGLMADPKLMTFRIVLVSRNRPMKPKVNFASSKRRRNDDGIPMEQQAQVAADHYHRLRTRDLGLHSMSGIKTDVPVYPVKPSGRGTAADFRSDLARLLTKQVPMTGDTFWAKNAHQTRLILEGRLDAAGFRFTEVDAGDYA